MAERKILMIESTLLQRLGSKIKSKYLEGLIILLLITPYNIFSQLPPSEGSDVKTRFPEEKIDSVVRLGISQGAFPGCQVLVANKDSVVFKKAYGYHTYSNLRTVELTDLYDLASITKVVASTLAIMKMCEDSLLSLEESVATYLPYFKGSRFGKATLRKVMAHQAGFESWIAFHDKFTKKRGFKKGTFSRDKFEKYDLQISDSLFVHNQIKERVYKSIKRSRVKRKAGYVYSGLFFYLVPELVFHLTGQPFEEYLLLNFYTPLGLKTISFQPLRFYDQDQIVPTEVDTFFRHQMIHGRVHDEGAILLDGISGNAGLFGNVGDLALILQMLLRDGEFESQILLSPKTIEEFTSCQFPENNNRRGLGFDKPLLEYDPDKSSVSIHASQDSFGHTGYTGTLMWADPYHDLIYIFLSNRVYPTRLNKKIYELNIRPNIHNIVYEWKLEIDKRR